MSTIIVFTSVSLDGVMQAPGRPDEDSRGGFGYSGWAAEYADSVIGEVAQEGMTDTDAIVLGRRTYDDFRGFWPKQKDNPFTEVLNKTRKYVVSTTLKEPLAWENSVLISDVAKLKEHRGKGMVVLGSGELVQTLMKRDLVNRHILLIHPILLGSGKHLFRDGGPPVKMRLIDQKVSTTGVLIATYERRNT